WCGVYTLLFWHRDRFLEQLIPPQIAALPLHTDVPPDALTFVHHFGGDPGNNTARRELPGAFVLSSGWLQHAVLPRAFGFVWSSNTDDHHLLQAGFDLGTPVASGQTLSWRSTTLWKDDSDRRNYHGSAIVSVLNGPGVTMWHPASVLRRSSSTSGWRSVANTVPLTPNTDPTGPLTGCVDGGDSDLQQVQFKIDNVPFH